MQRKSLFKPDYRWGKEALRDTEDLWQQQHDLISNKVYYNAVPHQAEVQHLDLVVVVWC